jgi:hypothetical protein
MKPARTGPLMLHSIIWDGTFHGRFENKEYAIDIYQRHIAEVKRATPPDRLLVYRVQEGWEPLCRFLDVPVPQGQAFPHLNDSAQFQRFVRNIYLVRRIALIAAGGLLAFLVVQWLLNVALSRTRGRSGILPPR